MSSDTVERQEQGQNSEALAGRIRELASKGAFKEAEVVREELMHSDAMALSLIVSTAEFIEEQKTEHLDPEHLELWKTLYEDFSPEEINCVFYSLEQVSVAKGKLVMAQRKINNRLYFIESGEVSLFYRQDGKYLALLKLGSGDIFGEDTFFEVALSSLSAGTLSEVSLRYLNRKDMHTWQDKIPGLYDKLGEYCRKHGKYEEASSHEDLDRRTNFRYPVSGVATAHILDQQGNKTAAYFKGGIVDISRSGICFTMKCSKPETARALLSRQLDLSVAFQGDEENPFQARGMIVKVAFHLHTDYTVHVNLDQKIEETSFKTFPCDWSVEENQEKG